MWRGLLIKMIPNVITADAKTLMYDCPQDRSNAFFLASASCSSSRFPFVELKLVNHLSAVQLLSLFFSVAPCCWHFLHFYSYSAFHRSLFTQSSHLSCGLPRFLQPPCFLSQIFSVISRLSFCMQAYNWRWWWWLFLCLRDPWRDPWLCWRHTHRDATWKQQQLAHQSADDRQQSQQATRWRLRHRLVTSRCNRYCSLHYIICPCHYDNSPFSCLPSPL